MSITFEKVEFSAKYKAEYKICSEYYSFYKNGKKVNDNIYRFTSLYKGPQNNFLFCYKGKEELYPVDICRDYNRRKHIRDYPVIVDINTGEELMEFKPYSCPYFIGGVICVCDNYYYNILNKVCYGQSLKVIKSKEFLFLDMGNGILNKNVSGVFKVNLNTGDYEIFS